MTTPTHADLLQQLTDTREADQKNRLAVLLRWGLLVGGALVLPVLVLLVAVAK